MADEVTTTKQVPSESDSEIFEEASTTSVSDQPVMLRRTEQSVSIPSALEAISFGTEINQDAGTSSDVPEPSSAESSSTLVASQIAVGVSEAEQQTVEDDPTRHLIPPRYRDVVPPITTVDYETYEPPPPPRPSWSQCMCCCFITVYNLHYTRKVRNSKYMLLVLVALMAIPISALYFGASYKDSCPMAEFSSVLLIIMGIVGVIFIVVRLMTLSTRRLLWNMEEPPKIISISLTLMLMIFMPMELLNFYTKKPVFDNPKDPLFCEKAFYNYVFYMNFVVLVIGILALLLHIPMKPRSAVQVVPREHFDAV